MKNNSLENINQMPNEIFDWMQTFNFYLLDHTKQQVILQHLTIEEYNEMHEANMAIEASTTFEKTKLSNKKNLDQIFDKAYTSSNKFSFKNINIWKVASLVLLGLCAGLFYKNSKQIALPNAITQTIHDTIFINNNPKIASKEKFDTVVANGKFSSIAKENKIAIKHDKKPIEHLTKKSIAQIKTKKNKLANEKNIIMPNQENTIFELEDIAVVAKLNQLKDVCNKSKRNSRMYNSSEKKFVLRSL